MIFCKLKLKMKFETRGTVLGSLLARGHGQAARRPTFAHDLRVTEACHAGLVWPAQSKAEMAQGQPMLPARRGSRLRPVIVPGALGVTRWPMADLATTCSGVDGRAPGSVGTPAGQGDGSRGSPTVPVDSGAKMRQCSDGFDHWGSSDGERQAVIDSATP
jgi:hypothetical protein